jgi:hypothetical protein
MNKKKSNRKNLIIKCVVFIINLVSQVAIHARVMMKETLYKEINIQNTYIRKFAQN